MSELLSGSSPASWRHPTSPIQTFQVLECLEIFWGSPRARLSGPCPNTQGYLFFASQSLTLWLIGMRVSPGVFPPISLSGPSTLSPPILPKPSLTSPLLRLTSLCPNTNNLQQECPNIQHPTDKIHRIINKACRTKSASMWRRDEGWGKISLCSWDGRVHAMFTISKNTNEITCP